jgi:hypothetical protein
MVNKTILNDQDSQKIRVSMPHWCIDYLKQGQTRKMSKGIVAYETILMVDDRFEDDLTELETMINNQLNAHSYSLASDIEKIKNSSAVLVEAHFDGAIDSEAKSQEPLWFPQSFVQDIRDNEGQRYIGQWIAECVEKAHHSAYTDRFHRISVKKDILAKIEDGEECDTVIGQGVVKNESSQFTGVGTVHEQVVDQTEDVHQRILQTDLEAQKARDIINNNDIKKSRKYRVPLVEAISGDACSRSKIITVASNCFPDIADATAQNYADEIIDGRDSFHTYEFESDTEIVTGDELYCASEVLLMDLVEAEINDLKEALSEMDKVHYPSVIEYLEQLERDVNSPLVSQLLGQVRQAYDEHNNPDYSSALEAIRQSQKQAAENTSK